MRTRSVSIRAISVADERSKQWWTCARERNIPIRVGVNSGSLEKELVEKYHGVTAEGIAGECA
ncbi:MAG: flavodoxin-dependent (E)-4-hydroxy-3-methylbut-2-enyl-diphosphate synthase [Eubacterium ramulus]